MKMDKRCSSAFASFSNILKAAFTNDVEKLEELIASSPSRDLNEQSCCFRLKPLHYAAWGGSRHAFFVLVCSGARLERGKDVENNRVKRITYATLMEMATGQIDPDQCGGSKFVRKGKIDREGLIRDLERGFVLKPWAWEVRRLLLIRDGDLAVLPKDICRLLVRKYCWDKVSIFE